MSFKVTKGIRVHKAYKDRPDRLVFKVTKETRVYKAYKGLPVRKI
jgi:hypothetical protein